MNRFVSAICSILCLFIQANAQGNSDSMNEGAKSMVSASSLIAEEGGSALSDSIKKSGQALPPDLLQVDVMPTLISRKDPHYPETALKAGIEGMVYVKILVGTDGKPMQVDVVKSDAEVLNAAAVDAAKQFVFTPASKDNKPVDVWVTVPFKFKLAPGKKQVERNAQVLPSQVHKPTVLVVTGPKALEGLINYPREAIRKRIEGAVGAMVRLNDEKHTTEVKILSGIGGGCDEEVLHALSTYKFYEDKNLPKFEEAGAVSVAVQFILPAKK